MSRKLSLKDLHLKDKQVVMRVDFNVPLKEGKILDDTRIRESLPSIHYILSQGASLVLITHLGRPRGEKILGLSLRPISERLEILLGKKVIFSSSDLTEVKKEAKLLKRGEILLMENIRFFPQEEHPEKDPSFVDELKSLGDLFVNDAFSTSHRDHASTVRLAKAFSGKAAAGFLVERELHYIDQLLKNPKRPLFALIGGSKISTKLGAVKTLLNHVDGLILGGGMVYTFLKAKGIEVGKSIVEEAFIEEARKILIDTEKRGFPLFLPIDLKVTSSLEGPGEVRTISLTKGIPHGFEGVDVGPKTIEAIGKTLEKAKTILWNGPFGVYEIPPFDQGTLELVKILASLNAEVLVGGGDSVGIVQKTGLGKKMVHLSTGGGATLEYLKQGSLPGIEALSDK